MRAELERHGLDWTVDSAGTAAYHVGNPPDGRATACAAGHGVDISGLRARQAVADDFSRFTHIYALDAANLRDLRSIRPGGGSATLSLLLDTIPGRQGQPVADPYYGDRDGFEVTWQDVSSAARAICETLTP